MKKVASSKAESKKAPSTKEKSTVAIVGVGYVGLPLVILAAKKKMKVIAYDVDVNKIADLKRGIADYITPKEQEELKELKNITFTTDDKDLKAAHTYIVCVPTPVDEHHEPDLEPVRKACDTVSLHLKHGDLVAIESTIHPGTCEDIILPILEGGSGLVGEKDFYLVHCPERINPGDEHWNLATIPRVIGGLGKTSLEKGLELYKAILDSDVHAMPALKEAEAAKMVENAFRDINIAFVNELAMSFDKAGIDLVSVLEGAATKPFAFMQHRPGCGVGGHCIPVDPYYLIRYGEENGFTHHFLKTARTINNAMPAYTVKKLVDALKKNHHNLKHAKVALLGMSYKKNIGDLRESPAFEIKKELIERGASVRHFDPFLPDLSDTETLSQALHGADAAIIATDHNAFTELKPADFLREGVRIVIDGRNCLSKEAFVSEGLEYQGIGH